MEGMGRGDRSLSKCSLSLSHHKCYLFLFQELAIDVAIKYGNKLRDLSKVESTVDDSLKSATDTVLLLAGILPRLFTLL